MRLRGSHLSIRFHPVLLSLFKIGDQFQSICCFHLLQASRRYKKVLSERENNVIKCAAIENFYRKRETMNIQEKVKTNRVERYGPYTRHRNTDRNILKIEPYTAVFSQYTIRIRTVLGWVNIVLLLYLRHGKGYPSEIFFTYTRHYFGCVLFSI
jgi:hypothetical protein